MKKTFLKLAYSTFFATCLNACTSGTLVNPTEYERIDANLRQNKDAFRRCYETEQLKNESLAGKIVVRFEIQTNGMSSKEAIDSTTMNNANVENCLLKVIHLTSFSKPLDGVPETVKYPFEFKSIR